MERKGGEEFGVQHHWFSTPSSVTNNPENLPRRDLPPASLPENYVCWDPILGGNLVYPNTMLPSHLYQNPTPSQSPSHNDHLFGLQNSSSANSFNNQSLSTNNGFGDQSQNHHLTAALNRLSISNSVPSDHDHAHHHAGSVTSNLRGNGFGSQFATRQHLQEEQEMERLKNQYVLLMAHMDQYMRLHGSPYVNGVSSTSTSNNHGGLNSVLPQLWSRQSNFPLMEVGPPYTGASLGRGSTSDLYRQNIAQLASVEQFGTYGYNPMRANSSLRNGVISNRASSRYTNGTGRGRLSTDYSSSSLEERGQLATLGTKDHDHGGRGARFTNGGFSARNQQQSPSSFNLNLEEMRGQIAVVAKEHAGSRFLQKKLEEGKQEEIEMIFSEVMDADFHDLMVDQFGSEFVQKLVEATGKEGWSKMLELVMNDEKRLKDICTDQHGSRAMQKLLERVETREQQSSFMRLLRRITIPLSKTQPGYYVIQVCLKHFSPESTKGVLELVLENCLSLAKDKFGCCLVQSSVHYAYKEAKERLVADITEHARILSEDPYGNYVVQYIIGLKIPRVTSDILAQLLGSFVNLSMNKYGSNVAEKTLKEAGEEHVVRIVNEMITSPHFLTLLQDPYGNYVVQSALGVSKGAAHNALVQLVRSHYPCLHSHPHGKRVLDKTRGHRHRC